MEDNSFDLVIVGGGVSACALTFLMSRYSNIKSIAILEKYGSIAPLNSNAKSNSQTLHCGDIETNYPLEKAKKVKQVSNMIVNYKNLVTHNNFIFKFSKMILAVGESECKRLKKRHDEFKESFPYMKLWNYEQIAKIEPSVALKNGKKRPEEILASGCTDEYCAVDYGNLSKSFINESRKNLNKISINVSKEVKKISKVGKVSHVCTSKNTFIAKFVVVSAGAHSLLFANQLGYGLNFSILPLAGSFYYTPKILNGKVYTMQQDKLPFAAIHGDPDLLMTNKTRFGPTVLVIPKLERYINGTYLDFWISLRLDMNVIKVFWKLIKDKIIRNYILKNFLFEIPKLREFLFSKDARKIIPDLTSDKLFYAKGVGGIRPQIINKTTQELQLGESSILPEKDNFIFNITPSPGASSCLGNAYRDAKIITERLSLKLDKKSLINDLLDGKDLI